MVSVRACRHIVILQKVADEMAKSLEATMEPVLQDVLANFLPYLLAPPASTPRRPLLLDPCEAGTKHRRDGCGKPPRGSGLSFGSADKKDCTDFRAKSFGWADSFASKVDGKKTTARTADAYDGALIEEKLAGDKTKVVVPSRLDLQLLPFGGVGLAAAVMAAQGYFCYSVLLLAPSPYSFKNALLVRCLCAYSCELTYVHMCTYVWPLWMSALLHVDLKLGGGSAHLYQPDCTCKSPS